MSYNSCEVVVERGIMWGETNRLCFGKQNRVMPSLKLNKA